MMLKGNTLFHFNFKLLNKSGEHIVIKKKINFNENFVTKNFLILLILSTPLRATSITAYFLLL